MTKCVLVTGGCGFIASNFINIFHTKYPDVVIVNLDKIDYCSDINNIKPDSAARTVRGNIHNSELVRNLIEEYQFDTVFHFAAQSHVDNSFNDPLSFTMENAYGTHVLVEIFRRHKPDVEFIHFSTDEVYGECTDGVPFSEKYGVLKPTNPYSASKAAAEMIVRSYIESFKMNIKIIRCNNVYGPNQYPEKLIPKFIKLLKEDKPCTLHGTKSSEVKRAFLHVDDVVNAVLLVLQKGQSGEIYNISSDYELSVMDVSKIIIEELKGGGGDHLDKWLTIVEDRPFNDSRYYITCDKIKGLGWKQEKDEYHLREFIKSYAPF